MKRVKLALICTIGGHFEQMYNLKKAYSQYDHFWITNRNKQTESVLSAEKKYFVKMAHFKKPFLYIRQLPEIIKIFRNEKPTHIISTGSGRTAFIPFVLAKLSGIKFIHVDTFSHVKGLSKFGLFLNKLNHKIYVQWNKPDFKNTVYIGPVFENEGIPKALKSETVFVTVETRSEQFTRLLDIIERLITEGIIKEKVIVQAGHTKYKSNKMEIFDFCTPDEIDSFLKTSKYVVTQESAGIATKCLKSRTRFLVCPRDYKFKELPAESDMKEKIFNMNWNLQASQKL